MGVKVCVLLLAVVTNVSAQSLEDLLDEQRFLRGLSELRLAEVLEQYIASHPPGDRIEAAQFQITAQRILVNEPQRSVTQRLADAERVLEIRAELIRAYPGDLRRPGWLADQAADLLFVVLPLDASGLTRLFGLPSPSQHAQAQRVARQINELMAEAELDIERVILQIESTTDYAKSIPAQMKRRRLSDEERDRRIPFFRGIGAFLHAEFNDHDTDRRRQLYALAADLLVPLAERLEGVTIRIAQLYGGLALARLGKFEAADALFGPIVADSNIDPSTRFAANMGKVVNQIVHEGPPAGLEALDQLQQHYASGHDLFFRILIADQQFLLRRTLAMNGPQPQREQRLAEAFTSYTDLLDRDLGVSRATVRAIVFARLTLAASGDVPLNRLPALVSVARAQHLAGDEKTRSQGIELFEEVLTRADLTNAQRATAGFGLARALLADDQRLLAVRTFTQLAREQATAREAERAIELAATVAADLYQRSPSDVEVRAVLGDAVSLLLERYENLKSIDRWRYTAGRLALTDQRFDSALAHFGTVTPDAEQWLDAQFMRIVVLRTWARGQTNPVDRTDRYRQLLAMIERVQPMLNRGATSAGNASRTETLRYYEVSLRVYEAEAWLALDEPPRATVVLAGIEDDPAMDGPLLAQALLVRIDALYAAGRSAEVPQELDRLLQVSPDDAGMVLAAMLKARQSRVTELLDVSRNEQAADRAQRELLPLAEAIGRWLKSRGDSDETAVRLRAADGYRLSQQYEDALRLYDELLAKRPNAQEALFGQAECLFHLPGDRDAEAMIIYRRIGSAG
ncbi:MAG: hypothetical protein V3T53_13990, partial [Phycisphaerales bacterium]